MLFTVYCARFVSIVVARVLLFLVCHLLPPVPPPAAPPLSSSSAVPLLLRLLFRFYSSSRSLNINSFQALLNAWDSKLRVRNIPK